MKSSLRYLFLIVVLWIAIIVVVFNCFGERLVNTTESSRNHRPENYNAPVEPIQENQYSYDLDEVTIERDRTGHYVYEGQINDEDVMFIVDTGASDVSIPGYIVERLGLDEGEMIHFQTANGIVIRF